jgi:hypothetical protein
MAKEKKIKVKYEEIRNSPLFAGVPDKLIKKIATYFNGKTYAVGEVIIK